MGHTPGPWRISDCTLGRKLLIEHGDESTISLVIGSVYEDGGRLPQRANAELIVRAVNSHADLLAALEAALETIKFYDENYETRCSYVDGLAAIAKAKGAL